MTVRGAAPELDGFTFLELIGQGGFADVFLYQQQMPTRRVAVKVLLASAVDGPAREQFNAEANVMAQLSGHPSIVPIYQAGISRDDRPYLVMEYCPPPSLAGRFRTERFGVPEALETMIKISAAVETAHRAGILHRDVKPHNILTSSFGSPMLTDFGIAGTTTDDQSGAYGLSVPWSPPEAFGETMSVDPRSDVYSLLAGRSPFEGPGGANDNATLMSRIERQPMSRVHRADVPDSLQEVMARAMAKDVAGRHPTAMAFARSLQDVQQQLRLGQTRIDVLDASPTAAPVQDGEQRTQVRPVQIIVPEGTAGTRLRPIVVPQVASAPPGQIDGRTARKRPGAATADLVPDTMARGGPVVADQTDGSHFLSTPGEVTPPSGATASRSSAGLVAGLLLAAAVAAVALAAVVLPDGEGDRPPTASSTSRPAVADVVGEALAPPRDLGHQDVADGVRFTWGAPEGVSDALYLVSTGSGPGELAPVGPPADTTAATVPAGRGEVACIEVSTVVGSERSEPVQACEARR